MRPALCASEPVASDVLLLEDEPHMSRRLAEQLKEHGIATCTVAATVADLATQLSRKSFEAVSIDWELHSFFVGPRVIRILRSTQPNAATIVYTKHRKGLSGAQRSGTVDECVLKVERQFAEYLQAMRRVVRLGHARSIAERLKELGTADVPALPHCQPLDEETERSLCALGRAETAKLVFQGIEGPSLLPVLVRRGWWKDRRTDIMEYAALPTPKKLQTLLHMIAVSSEHLAMILGSSEEEAEALLGGTCTPGMAGLGPGSDAHRLLAVLSSLLRLANYHPDLMAELWTSKNIYGETTAAPPWDSVSLRQYLCAGGQRVVADCLAHSDESGHAFRRKAAGHSD